MANTQFSTIVVGAGFAGASAALYLSSHGRVCVVEGSTVAGSASGASAGLVNPLMGRKARPVANIDASLEAIRDALARAGASELFQQQGVVRPARSEKQVDLFQERAEVLPEHAAWLSPGEARERYPEVKAPLGALLVRQGGWLPPEPFIHAMLDTVERSGGSVRFHSPVSDWGEESERAFISIGEERLYAERLVLALGAGALTEERLSALELRSVKGQTITVGHPDDLGQLPALSGSGYVVPNGDRLILGSTYEHDYDDIAPSEEQCRYILEKTARMVPALMGAEVLETRAGLRVYAGHHSKPSLAKAPGYERVWVFTGLGSRGLLSGPQLARARFKHHSKHNF